VEEIARRLPSGGLVGIDTSPFIYHLEGNVSRQKVIEPFFSDLAAGRVNGVTSVVTLLELLVRPIELEAHEAARDFESFLYGYPNLRVVDVDRGVARLAAKLRASYRLAAADCLQLGSAINAGASVFLTNDRALARVGELRILLVDDLIRTI
jgi:predicted nucleic acid-binding protein